MSANDPQLLMVYQYQIVNESAWNTAELHNAAEIAARLGAWLLARALLRRECVLSPGEGRAWLSLANPGIHGGDAAQTLRLLRRVVACVAQARTLTPVEEIHAVAVAASACQAVEHPKSLEILCQLWQIGLNTRVWLSRMTAAALGAVDPDLADKSVRRSITLLLSYARTPEVRHQFILNMLQKGKVGDAITIMDRSGTDRLVSLASAVLAGYLTNRRLGRSVFFPTNAVPERAQQFYVLGAPKSASLFVANIVSEMFGYPIVNLSQHQTSGHDIEIEFFLDAFSSPCVVHQHGKSTPMSISIFNEFDIMPLISIRNVFDTLISLRDWRVHRNYSADQHFGGLADDEQINVIFLESFKDLLDFYVGWYRAAQGRRVRAMLVDHRDLVTDTAAIITRFLSENGAPIDPAAVAAATDRAARSPMKANFNPARGTRLPFDVGYDMVPADLIALARQVYKNYPDVDFRMFDHRYETASS
ncbi:hypothetical protein BAL199_13173 [alpha proteobacterium BAL199]|nr:hypothetical protein BAL199_13173 [alpha proteobacterium BAL199]